MCVALNPMLGAKRRRRLWKRCPWQLRPAETDQTVRAYAVPPAGDGTTSYIGSSTSASRTVLASASFKIRARRQILVVGPAAAAGSGSGRVRDIASVACSIAGRRKHSQSLQATAPDRDCRRRHAEKSRTAATRGPKVVPLRHLNWQSFENELTGIFGRQLPVTVEHGGDGARYNLEKPELAESA